MPGISCGHAVATAAVLSYYAVLIAQSVFYFFASFQAVLPWSVYNATVIGNATVVGNATDVASFQNISSAESYYRHVNTNAV